jgi:hypothetical protein
MKKFLCILVFGSFSLASLVNKMFISTQDAYATIHLAMLSEQSVSVLPETKIQISKKALPMLICEFKGAAKRAY